MTRIASTFVLLAGLSGCISFSAAPQPGDKKTAHGKQGSSVNPSGMLVQTSGNPTLPTMPAWTAHPDHLVLPPHPAQDPSSGRMPGDAVAGRLQSNYAPIGQSRPGTLMTQMPTAATPRNNSPYAPLPNPVTPPPAPIQQVAHNTPANNNPLPVAPEHATTTPTASAPIAPAAVAPAPSVASAPVTTPRGSLVIQPLTPAVPTGNPTPPATLQLPPNMPVATTPRNDTSTERQVSHVAASPVINGGGESILQMSRSEPKKLTIAPPPTRNALTNAAIPAVGVSEPTEVKPARQGSPLMRLVNTKRITLNFEIKDVGPSGLSTVELWYTQDCKDWKKYDAPTQAQAYVIEVDEEGMYGFTLVARSGLGLGKEPPAPGDQPAVWVIVDLTRPDVQLTEVTPPTSARNQTVTIGWKATDKNLGRGAINLAYAEKEDGPWKPIASNVENTGKYVWQVPQGLPRFLVRVEAADLAGNVARVQSSRPILLDNSRPEVLITNVEAAPIR